MSSLEYIPYFSSYPKPTSTKPSPKPPVPRVRPYLQQQMNHSLHPSCYYGQQKCQTRPEPCDTQFITFQPRFPGCAPEFVSWKDVDRHPREDPPLSVFEVGRKNPAIWVADLNPIHYRHQLIHGGKWYPEMSRHPHARQLWLQYLTSTLPPQSDAYTKVLNNPQESLPALQSKYGRMQFVSF